MKLKIKLWRTNSTVHMQVLEQEDVIRRGKFDVNSYPSLYTEFVDLRGTNKTYNDFICNFSCRTPSEADNYIEKVISWLDDAYIGGCNDLKIGDVCLMKNNPNGIFVKRELLAILPDDIMYRYVTRDNFGVGRTSNWKYAKPLKKSGWNAETNIWEYSDKKSSYNTEEIAKILYNKLMSHYIDNYQEYIDNEEEIPWHERPVDEKRHWN